MKGVGWTDSQVDFGVSTCTRGGTAEEEGKGEAGVVGHGGEDVLCTLDEVVLGTGGRRWVDGSVGGRGGKGKGGTHTCIWVLICL